MMLMVSPCRCQHCGQEMRAARQCGRRRRFCSNACRQAEFRNNHPNPNSEVQPELPLRNEAPCYESRLALLPGTDPDGSKYPEIHASDWQSMSGRPTISNYFAVIETIESKLREGKLI